MHQPIPFDAIFVITALPVRPTRHQRTIRTRLARRLLAARYGASLLRTQR